MIIETMFNDFDFDVVCLFADQAGRCDGGDVCSVEFVCFVDSVAVPFSPVHQILGSSMINVTVFV